MLVNGPKLLVGCRQSELAVYGFSSLAQVVISF